MDQISRSDSRKVALEAGKEAILSTVRVIAVGGPDI
jgi:hypothetical protein